MLDTPPFESRAVDTLTPSAWVTPGAFTVASHVPVETRRSAFFFLVSAYVFFLPVQFANDTLNMAPSDLVLALALVFGLSRLRFVANTWGAVHLGLLLAFLLSACVSISEFGSVPNYVVIKVAGLLALFAGYLCLTSVAPGWADIRSLLRTFVMAATLHVLVAVFALATGWTFSGLNEGTVGLSNIRLSGMLIDPNAFGGLVMVALTIQLFTQEGGRALIKGLPGLAISGILAVGLALTLSRSAWIGFGFALTVAAFYRWRLGIAWAAFAVAAAIAVWMTIVNPDPSLRRVERTNTAMERIDQIEIAIPIFSRSPILGTGIGGFTQKIFDPITGGPRIIHNTAVWIMTELGLVGLTAYLAFIVWFFLQGTAALKVAGPEHRPLILALMCAHAGMIGVSTGIEAFYQRHWWFTMALLASCCALVRSEAARRIPAGARQLQ